MLQTREEYVKQLEAKRIDQLYKFPQEEWSEPQYKCPKCGGNVRKSLLTGLTVACIPPVSLSYYHCDSCEYSEYLDD